MLNKLYLGFNKTVEPPTRGLFIHDNVPDIPRARIFDPAKHSFNPLKNIDYRKARALADVLYAASPQGDNTLTVRNGRRALVKMLPKSPRLEQPNPTGHIGDEEALAMIEDLLQSPILKSVLCGTANQFSFNPNSLILAKID